MQPKLAFLEEEMNGRFYARHCGPATSQELANKGCFLNGFWGGARTTKLRPGGIAEVPAPNVSCLHLGCATAAPLQANFFLFVK